MAKLHGKLQRYLIDILVTEGKRSEDRTAWLWRGLTKEELQEVADNRYKDSVRDLTPYLNDWRAIKSL